MVLRLHGMTASTCTKRVITVLNEKNVEYEFVNVSLAKGEHKSPAFLAMNPFGKIPALEDDGFTLFESRAICKYIAYKYADQGTPLLPRAGDMQAFARLEQASYLEAFYTDGPLSKIGFEKVFKPAFGKGPTDDAKVAEYLAELENALAVYETILSKQAYIAGDQLTVVDLFHLPYATMVGGVGFQATYDKYPSFAKWLAGLQARESWKKANA